MTKQVCLLVDWPESGFKAGDVAQITAEHFPALTLAFLAQDGAVCCVGGWAGSDVRLVEPFDEIVSREWEASTGEKFTIPCLTEIDRDKAHSNWSAKRAAAREVEAVSA